MHALRPPEDQQALLLSSETRQGNLWLNASTSIPSLRLPDQAFQDNARLLLGVNTFSSAPCPWVCTCGTTVDGNDVQHAFACPKLSSLTIGRHDATVDDVRVVAHYGGRATTVEPRYGLAGSRSRSHPHGRGDISTVIRPGPGHTIIDVTYINPLNPDVIHAAATRPGAAAARAERRKSQEYFRDHNCPGYQFRPFAVETFGRLGAGSMQVLREIVDATGFSGRQRQRMFDNAYRRTAVTRCRWNSKLLSAALEQSVARTGDSFMAGRAVPSAVFED